ncbi:MAG: hypothetical protein IPL86_13200 [Flavobacteriales bacterium]|nr:hypothetical protein [Flavobacteriales bacterium]
MKRPGVEQTRALPVGNKTAKEDKHFSDYFDTDASKKRAKFVFGPYMKEFGYTFHRSGTTSRCLLRPRWLTVH